MDFDKLNLLKLRIEKMEKFNQVKILNIFNNSKIEISENRNGIFINLTELSKETLKKINDYVNYVDEQNSTLEISEEIKDKFKTKFFCKDNKDNSTILHNDI
jgi:hypothetical protein